VPIVFVLDAEQDRSDLVRQATKIGYDRLAGELAGGMTAWRGAGLPVEHLPLVGADALAGRPVLDVRQDAEFDAGHIPHALHVELGALADLDSEELPGDGIAVVCGHGDRAMTGASLLARRGHGDLVVLAGGTSGWIDSGRPSSRPR
jgi:rhodanese-related sulfurtransferase